MTDYRRLQMLKTLLLLGWELSAMEDDNCVVGFHALDPDQISYGPYVNVEELLDTVGTNVPDL